MTHNDTHTRDTHTHTETHTHTMTCTEQTAIKCCPVCHDLMIAGVDGVQIQSKLSKTMMRKRKRKGGGKVNNNFTFTLEQQRFSLPAGPLTTCVWNTVCTPVNCVSVCVCMCVYVCVRVCVHCLDF